MPAYRDRALLVSSTTKGTEQLLSLLSLLPLEPERLSDGAAARRALSEAAFALVLINAPLSDEFGHDLALHAAQATSAGVVLLVKESLLDEAAARVEAGGVFTVPKPLTRAGLHQAVQMALATHARIDALVREKYALESRLEQMRVVNRAKCTLMERLCMSEPEAHRYLAKQAMDLRTTKEAVAREILRTYGL